jgi:hypothetical protein
MDLHPYDNIERRYRHTDRTRDEGREVVAKLLSLPEPPSGELLFDLSIFSGGIGVLDRLAITFRADDVLWSRVMNSLQGRTPEEANTDEAWIGDLIWLLTGEEERVPIRPAAVQFVNEQRRTFQTDCLLTSRILISHQSDVNDWSVLWGNDTWLNYVGYSQG